MKTRVGILGPRDSTQVISEVANEFSEHLTKALFTYKSLEDVEKIVIEARDNIDVWLFSGQVPFSIAKKHLANKNGFFPRLNGSSLTKVLLDIAYKDKKKLQYLSFDTIPEKEVLETFTELGLNKNGLQLYPYMGYKPTEELLNYHLHLYNNGVVESCVTGVHSVYEKLIEMNVPAYRISATKIAIKNTISIALQRSETLHFKSSQISVLILQIHDIDQLISNNKTPFDAYRLNLRLQELIIEFTEKISGSFIQQGNDKFIIFSTRGSLEIHHNEEISILLEKVTIISHLTANIGIGYGKTVFGAEQNAHIALNYSKNKGNNIPILADENGILEGPLQSHDSLSFSYRSGNMDVIEKLNDAGVNLATYNKIISIQNKVGKGPVNSNDLANWLGMTQRNARRILSDLEKHNLARVVGSETPTTKGRPRKIYQVGIQNSIT